MTRHSRSHNRPCRVTLSPHVYSDGFCHRLPDRGAAGFRRANRRILETGSFAPSSRESSGGRAALICHLYNPPKPSAQLPRSFSPDARQCGGHMVTCQMITCRVVLRPWELIFDGGRAEHAQRRNTSSSGKSPGAGAQTRPLHVMHQVRLGDCGAEVRSTRTKAIRFVRLFIVR